MKARCPKCGRHGLVARFVGVTETVQVTGVDSDGLLIYGDTKSTVGRLAGVNCPACGETVTEDGVPIDSLAALAGWLGRETAHGVLAKTAASGQD